MKPSIEQFLDSGWKASLLKWWAHAEKAMGDASTEDERAAIREAMDVNRHPDTIVGFLTKEKAWELCKDHSPDMMIATGLTLVSDGKAFFFTDDPLMGYNLLPTTFVGSTFPLPLRTSKTVFSSIDEFCAVFCRDLDNGEPERYLASVQELLDYVESSYSQTGDTNDA